MRDMASSQVLSGFRPRPCLIGNDTTHSVSGTTPDRSLLNARFLPWVVAEPHALVAVENSSHPAGFVEQPFERIRGQDKLQEIEAELEARTAELERLLQELTEQRKLFERQAAELIEERRRRMAAFRTLGQLVHGRSVSRLTRLLAESATELTRARGACLTLRVKKRSTLLEVKGASGIATELVGIRFPAEGSVAALAMRTGKPQLVARSEEQTSE